MSTKRLFLAVCLILIAASWLGGVAIGQSATGTVSGQITDASGAVVSGTVVKLQSLERGTVSTTTANKAGIYVFPSVQPGPYHITVLKPGFKQVDLPSLVVNIQSHIEQNFRLAVGSVSESVTVLAEAPLLSTTGATVSTLVDREFVANMPLNGRSFQALITLTPGTVAAASSVDSPGQFSVNGQSPQSNYFTVDGVSANVGVLASATPGQSAGGTVPGLTGAGGTSALLSVDDMQEFRIQTSTFAPEFGRTPGAQVSIVSRSGANKFHGTLFEYFRNYHLDANDWFANAEGLAKPGVHQNDFGGVFGGPVRLPGYNGRDKTFSFFSYEGLRLRSPQVESTDVPTMAQRLAAAPSVAPFFNAFPVPSPNALISPAGYAVYANSFSNPSNADSTSLRIDQVINTHVSAFARYSYAPSSASNRAEDGEFALSTNAPANFGAQTLTGGLDWTISPSTNNEFRGNWSRSNTSSTVVQDNFGGATPLPVSALALPAGVSPSTSLSIFALINGTAVGLAEGLNTNNQLQQLNFIDNLSRVVGRHALKFGVDYRSILTQVRARTYFQEGVFFDVPSAQTGQAAEAEVSAGSPLAGLRYRNISLYAQDTFQTTRRFDLVYGLRWDLNPPPAGSNFTLYPTVIDLNNLNAATLGSASTSLWKTQYANFAPRLGFSYQLSTTPGQETVLRAGAGIFYDLGTTLAGLILEADSFPIGASNLLLGPVPFPLTGTDAVPPAVGGTPTGLLSFPAFDSNLKVPRTYEWNVALERVLGSDQTMSLTYVGASGQDLLRTEILDPINNPIFTEINYVNNSGASSYNALQFQYNRRLTHNFQALASYSWSHSIDDIPAGYAFPQPQYNPNLDRGPSDFDVRNAFAGSVSYNIPWKSESGIAHAIFGNWSVDGILKDYSSPPVDVVAVTVAAEISYEPISRPNLVPDVPLYLYGAQYPGGKAINPAAFTPAAADVQGTLSRDALRGFEINELDAVLRRQFNFAERYHLQFRGEFYNLFNHPNFALPGNDLAIPQDAAAFSGFGISPSNLADSLGSGGVGGGQNPLNNIGGPRSIQLAMKLIF